MKDEDLLARRFEENRDHLREVASRMLGSRGDAEDAVQEAWLRLQRTDEASIDNLGGWLTTVVARVCLDALRSRAARREEAKGEDDAQPAAAGDEPPDPERDLILADAIGPALLVVLETLAPAERVAFVLHDLFDLSFEEIAPIVGRSEIAARQLASRARRRVRGADTSGATGAAVARRRAVVDAFLAASRDGDIERLLAVLAPDVVVRADAAAVRLAEANRWGGAPGIVPEMRGARAVAQAFKGRARGAQRAVIDGEPGGVWAPGGQVRGAFVFTVRDDRIVAIDLVVAPDRVAALEIEILG